MEPTIRTQARKQAKKGAYGHEHGHRHGHQHGHGYGHGTGTGIIAGTMGVCINIAIRLLISKSIGIESAIVTSIEHVAVTVKQNNNTAVTTFYIGRLNWERVPIEAAKSSQSQAVFLVKEDAIHIKTKTFSLWSIFACGGPRRKRARVFSNRPDPKSDLIYLRFYVYSDNMDSKRVSNQIHDRNEGRVLKYT